MSRTDGASWSQFLRALLTDTIIAQQASHLRSCQLFIVISLQKSNVLIKYEGKIDENFPLCLCTADGSFNSHSGRK